MSLKNIVKEIREKRETLGITVKEFADALGLGKNGEKQLRDWERGNSVPSDDMYQRILSFALDRPYYQSSHDGAFRFVDLFAGIGGIRIPFQELGGYMRILFGMGSVRSKNIQSQLWGNSFWRHHKD